MSTPDVYERLEALISVGDLDYEGEEAFSESDVGDALRELHLRQQQQQQPIGILTRERFGAGRLWRIVPPSAEERAARTSSGTPAFASAFVAVLDGTMDEAALEATAQQLLHASGDVDSLGSLLTTITSAAASLPGSPINLQMVLAAADGALGDAEAKAALPVLGGAAAAAAAATPGVSSRGSRKSASFDSAAPTGSRKKPRPTAAAPSPSATAEQHDAAAAPREDAKAGALRVLLGRLLCRALARLVASGEETHVRLRKERSSVSTFACDAITRLQQVSARQQSKVRARSSPLSLRHDSCCLLFLTPLTARSLRLLLFVSSRTRRRRPLARASVRCKTWL